jgi:hypothetical protein
LFVYQIEQLAKLLKMCNNCKSFDHFTSNCNEGEKCAQCGDNHKTETCVSLTLKCPNCNEKHSAYYKGCAVYKSRFQQKIAQMRSRNKEESNRESNNVISRATEAPIPTGFMRSYSAALIPTLNENNVEKKVNDMVQNQKSVNSQLTEIKTSLDNVLKEIKVFNEIILQ